MLFGRSVPSCAEWIGEWLDACQRLGVPVHAVTHHALANAEHFS